MKKKLLLPIGILSAFLCFKGIKEKKVFICKSVKSNRYHYMKNCGGLSKCKAEIKITTKKRAEKYGRILCRIELRKIIEIKNLKKTNNRLEVQK
ncbi:hypothetical protein [Tenacibaculum amylolyticum]|uniref:hypothetical protein n=1 Tax=Tenacibaculum amylolyticum TaxID=104269 RepID=UPI003894F067